MAKWGKRILGAAAIGTVIAGLVYYFNNKRSGDEDEEFSDDFDDEDFNLDEDLKSAGDREYVPLNQAAKSDGETKENTAKSEDEASDKSSQETSTGSGESAK